MARLQLQEAATHQGPPLARPARQTKSSQAAPSEYPVREYIAGMARELAQMARWDGDDGLAVLLEAAVIRAEGARP